MQQIYFNLILNLKESGNSLLHSISPQSFLGMPSLSFIGFITSSLISLISWLIGKLSFIFYFIAKFILLAVDIIFSYVQKLCGLGMDYSSLESMISADSDIVFNLLITSKDIAGPIVKNLLGLAIFLIIFFTIVALIKAQLQSLNAQKSNYVVEVIRKTIKAFILLMITPMIAIGSIVGSNLLLQALYKATSSSASMSIGSQIFAASSVSANNFRLYAEADQRIPITYDFSREQEILDYYKDRPANNKFAAYLKSSDNPVYATYGMFKDEEFITYSSLKVKNSGTNEPQPVDAYHTTFDISPSNSKKQDAYSKYRRIEANAEQYYVMADVVDYAAATGVPLYFKTIEQMLDSICSIQDNTEKLAIFGKIVKQYKISFLDGSVAVKYDSDDVPAKTSDMIDYFKSKECKGISFYCDYIASNGAKSTEKHVHVCGARDEVDGAKFVVTIKELDSNNKEYFTPFYVNYYVKGSSGFYTEYLDGPGNIIMAKGFMMDSKYPTAMKMLLSNVVCYREDFAEGLVGPLGDVAKGNIGLKNNGFFGFLMMFFNPEDSFDASINIDPAKVQLNYFTRKVWETVISDGKVQLGYFMPYSDTNILGQKKTFALTILTLFNAEKFNIFLMFAAPIILIKIAFISFLGLIQRAYEMFVIIIFYPTAVVAIPVEDNGYTNWMQTFFNKLFSAYGMLLGINFVLMLFPIISEMEFFTQEDLANSKIAFKLCHFAFGGTMMNMTKMLNLLTVILFELVAFTLLDTKSDGGGIPDMINKMLGTDGDLSSDLAQNFAKAVKGFKSMLKLAFGAITLILKAIPHTTSVATSGDAVSKVEKSARNARKFKDFMNKLLPGGKIRERIAEKKALGKDKEKVDKARKKLEEELKKEKEMPEAPEKPTLKEGATPEEKEQYEKQMEQYEQKKKEYEEKKKKAEEEDAANITKHFEAMLAQEKEYTKSLEDPSINREAKAEQGIADKRMGITDADRENEGEVSNRGEGDEEDEEIGYMSDDELDSREKELNKNIGRIEESGIADKDDSELTEAEKVAKRAYIRQKKELERIKKEKSDREAAGLDLRGKKKENEARKTALENEYNDLAKRVLANDPTLSEADKERYKQLEKFHTRNDKDAKKKHEEEVAERKKQEQTENTKTKERIERQRTRNNQDEALFLNRESSEEAVQERIKEASDKNAKLLQEVIKLIQQHPEWGISLDALKNLEFTKKFEDEEGNIKEVSNPEAYKQFDDIMKLAQSKGAGKKDLQKLESFRDSQEDMQHLGVMVDQREKRQAKWIREKTRQQTEDQRAVAGRKGRQHSKMEKEVQAGRVDQDTMDKTDKEIKELEDQLAKDPTNLALKSKLNELKNKRAEMDAANARYATWKQQDSDPTVKEEYDREQNEKKEVEEAKKKAIKFLQGLDANFTQADIDKWTEYFIDPEAAKKRIEERKRMEQQGAHSMATSARGFKEVITRGLGARGEMKRRDQAIQQAKDDHEKTKQEITSMIASGQLKGLGYDDKTKRIKSFEDMSDAEIEAYIATLGSGILSKENIRKRDVLRTYMEQRAMLKNIETIGEEGRAHREERDQWVKDHRKDS